MAAQNFMFSEGQSTTRPPLFNGTNYAYWKNRMRVYMQGSDYLMWEVVWDGPYVPMKRKSEQSKEMILKRPKEFDKNDKEKIQLNAKAITALYCALDPFEFDCISACVSAKEIWDKLEVAHEGTNEVRKSKMNRLVQKYELFKMNPNEDIKSMFTRFTKITNELVYFDNVYSKDEKVRKILRSLPKGWSNIRMTIEEAHNLSHMTTEVLQGKLLTHEMAMKDYDSEEDNKKKKTIALKATQHSEENFKKQGGLKRNNGSDKYKGDSNKKDKIICYRCKKPGHVKFECPFGNEKSLKAKEKRSKKALVTTWSDDSSDKESSDSEVANLCFMAREEDTQEVSFQSIPNDEFNSLEELQDAFDELYEESRKMSAKNASLKKTIASLLNEKEGLHKSIYFINLLN
ncbi:hypothetical protein SLEP1_g54498 [Rubroshorea leprosula]|uniref:CCHC-type domain-containing protein n=1 Tax=Rubroshorea leprosula TaxID=152421 RepID=A0AAV5MFH5_9ROSI|nr:hypothetical protein SLEP1_g54498 [Rubroshorea leprosula]